MLNPLSLLKSAKVYLILGVISFGLVMLNTYLKDQREIRNDLITVNAEKVSAEARVQTLANANAILEAKTLAEEKFREDTVAALFDLNVTFTKISTEQQKQKRVLEGDRLNRLANSRVQDRIESLSNRATRARFDEVEGIFDGS